MTLRQKLLKRFYPILTLLQQKNAMARQVHNTEGIAPPVSFHSLSVTLNNGNVLSFAALKGKKVLLVNTASNCGYTAQYAELQKLYQYTKEELQIIAFPANDFKEQEMGSNEEIAAFCSVNYGTTFPVCKKSRVVKGPQQHPVYRWLSHQQENGWNEKAPSWNFAKYLVNEEGVLTHYFEPAVSPLGPAMGKALST